MSQIVVKDLYCWDKRCCVPEKKSSKPSLGSTATDQPVHITWVHIEDEKHEWIEMMRKEKDGDQSFTFKTMYRSSIHRSLIIISSKRLWWRHEKIRRTWRDEGWRWMNEGNRWDARKLRENWKGKKKKGGGKWSRVPSITPALASYLAHSRWQAWHPPRGHDALPLWVHASFFLVN